MAVQMEEMDILSGCVGWQLEGLHAIEGNAAGGRELTLLLGPLFRLRLLLAPPAASPATAEAVLEFASPGARQS